MKLVAQVPACGWIAIVQCLNGKRGFLACLNTAWIVVKSAVRASLEMPGNT